jgi:hypothetical protein
MQAIFRHPTADVLNEAVARFDKEFAVIEEALEILFRQYPTNTYLPGVLLKVVALNRLYSTQILAVMDVARHIHHHAAAIDAGLATGSADVVELIGLVTIEADGKKRYNYSFATKYSSWHNPTRYPIWDSRAEHYLWAMQKQEHFAADFAANKDLWTYEKFREIVEAFQRFYGLKSFSFKSIDKLLWSEAALPLDALFDPILPA